MADVTAIDIEIRELTEQQTAVVRHRIAMSEVGSIPGWLGQTYEAIERAGAQPSGMPFVRTLAIDAGGMEVEVGWPVATPVAEDGDVHASTLPGGPAAVATYFGPYDGIAPAYESVQRWCQDHGRVASGAPWESYFTDPNEEPDSSKWRTDIHFPLAPVS
ncbi:MAG: GyrI-like domain-containing protein [Dehalococcoidia bacterium]|nr:GyrI-like domain-containing protein [Dehalococcoidia bacterium]